MWPVLDTATFQDGFGLCECGQYWVSNSSVGFLGNDARGEVQLIIGLFNPHWAILGVPGFVGKL